MPGARNQFKGIIKAVRLGGVMAEVVVTVGDLEIVSAMTRTSAEALGLPRWGGSAEPPGRVGRPVLPVNSSVADH
jgi:molybdopterin-binding protein